MRVSDVGPLNPGEQMPSRGTAAGGAFSAEMLASELLVMKESVRKLAPTMERVEDYLRQIEERHSLLLEKMDTLIEATLTSNQEQTHLMEHLHRIHSELRHGVWDLDQAVREEMENPTP